MPVMLSAWYGGLKPGLLATAVSALLGSYFLLSLIIIPLPVDPKMSGVAWRNKEQSQGWNLLLGGYHYRSVSG